MMRASHQGFTLIELVVSITLSSIVLGLVAAVMTAPVDRYTEQVRRNELVEMSDRVMRTFNADLERALPNSVRTGIFGTNRVVQMLEVGDIVYYQDETPANPATGLNVTQPDASFSVYGNFADINNGLAGNAWLSVSGALGDPYAAGAMKWNAVPGGAAFGVYPINLAPAFQFPNGPSPTNRLFAVTRTVTYICDLANGRLRRFTSPAIPPAMPADESAPQLVGAGAATVATGVTACQAACAAPAGNPCKKTLTVAMTLSRGIAPDDDRVDLMQQFAVENTP